MYASPTTTPKLHLHLPNPNREPGRSTTSSKRKLQPTNQLRDPHLGLPVITSSISQIENSRKQLSNENPLLNLLRLETENTSQVRRRFPEYKISKEEKDLYFSQDFEPIVDWGSLPIIVGSIFIFHRGLLKTWREKKTRSAIYVMLFGDVFCWCFIFSSLY
eukprot:UN23269